MICPLSIDNTKIAVCPLSIYTTLSTVDRAFFLHLLKVGPGSNSCVQAAAAVGVSVTHVDVFREGDDGHAGVAHDGSQD